MLQPVFFQSRVVKCFLDQAKERRALHPFCNAGAEQHFGGLILREGC